jgi:hypothetical protein
MISKTYLLLWDDPVNRHDPSGEFWETIIDIFSIGVSAKDLITNPSWGNAGYLLWDVGAAVLPFAPGSYIKKGVTAGSKAVKNAKKSTKVAMQVANSASDFKKGNYLVGSYSGLKKAFKGKGKKIEIHHLIEKRFSAGNYVKVTDTDKWLSIPLDKKLHRKITKRYRKAFRYKRFGEKGHYNLTKKEMKLICKKVYHDIPELRKLALDHVDQIFKKK